jgi:outer membrane protein assembly factor BamB
LKQIARREKQFNRVLQQAAMQSQRNAVVCKFGTRLPRSGAEAFAFDATNGVTKWQDAIELELDQLDEHDTDLVLPMTMSLDKLIKAGHAHGGQ